MGPLALVIMPVKDDSSLEYIPFTDFIKMAQISKEYPELFCGAENLQKRQRTELEGIFFGDHDNEHHEKG